MERVVRSWACVAVVCGVALGCKKETPAEVAPATAPAEPAPSAAAAGTPSAAAAPLAEFDPCVVGAWRSKSVTLSAAPVKAAGGAGVAMSIAASGKTELDFGSMADIQAGGQGMSFDFRYSGTATGRLKTPVRGQFESESPDYSKLKVTANVKLPGAAFVPMFKDTPISEVAKMAEGIAAAAKGVPGVPGAPPGPAPKGIDAAPIFSSSSYECRPDSLTLTGAQDLVWEFVREKR